MINILHKKLPKINIKNISMNFKILPLNHKFLKAPSIQCQRLIQSCYQHFAETLRQDCMGFSHNEWLTESFTCLDCFRFFPVQYCLESFQQHCTGFLSSVALETTSNIAYKKPCLLLSQYFWNSIAQVKTLCSVV